MRCGLGWGMVSVLAWCLLSTGAAHSAESKSPNQLSPQEIREGWIQLFDGESLFGWKGTPGINWEVKEGVLSADSGPIGGLFTTMEFSDYELRCDFEVDAETNSALFVHSLSDPQNPVTDCYEINLCDQHPKFRTGGIVGIAPPTKFVPAAGGWKTMHVTVRGPAVRVQIDGTEVLDFVGKGEQARAVGHIGLQKNVGKVRFRNIFLKPLGEKELLNNRDLTGWHLVPGGKSQFTMQDGELHVVNGRGYLESDATFKDFVLQAEVFSNGKHLNSGIFFRALPGTEKQPAEGYEAQIRNEWKGDDRTQPVDFGTGAIYRRIPTRKVVSNDFEWFTMTVAARGPRIAVWVNGFPVTDWADNRRPHKNPRNGLRTEAGHLSLQGHDPTTDIKFRKLRIAELP